MQIKIVTILVFVSHAPSKSFCSHYNHGPPSNIITVGSSLSEDSIEGQHKSDQQSTPPCRWAPSSDKRTALSLSLVSNSFIGTEAIRKPLSTLAL